MPKPYMESKNVQFLLGWCVRCYSGPKKAKHAPYTFYNIGFRAKTAKIMVMVGDGEAFPFETCC